MSDKQINWIRITCQILAVIVILALGIGIFIALKAMKKPPVKVEKESPAPLLYAQKVSIEDMQMTVKGYGTVQPKIDVDIIPQIAGKVIECSDQFVNGGFFKAYQPLVMVEQKDYQLAVENAKAAVASAKVTVDREQAEAAVARQEWDQLNPGTEPTSPLVLRQPQIQQAQAQLQAAQAQLAKAQLDLERTVISMPFDGRISRKTVDIGQYITPGQPIGQAYGTGIVEIVIPLEDRDLEWFDIPLGQVNKKSVNTAETQAIVSADFAGKAYTWTGKAKRLQGKVDETSRMVNVVVEVTNPFDIKTDEIPLTPGMFVNVEIKGKTLKNVVKVPRYALKGQDTIWLSNDNHLKFSKVKIARFDDNYAYISQGVKDGDVVITSPLDTATDMMKIRTKITENSSQNGGSAQ